MPSYTIRAWDNMAINLCLLCPSPVVADGLCVPCGAKLWAAQITSLLGAAAGMPQAWQTARAEAIRTLTPGSARAFLDKYERARSVNDYGGSEEPDDG